MITARLTDAERAEAESVMVYNLMCDLKKKEMDHFTRAKLIKSYLDEQKLSIRQLSKRMNIPKSTLEDWTRWNKIDKDDYDEKIEAGFTHTDVYQALREGSLSPTPKPIDSTLESCISKLSVFKIKPPYSKDTKMLITRLRHVLDVIEGQVK